ncbi:hypothetical protein DFH08DRAFT_816023 [Mycena albidolilacea]|uniref:Uncharacterized protein n=1 Tax=Mycena albidolilacea TaxID=1033008 RepID=A0AAD7EIA9_9AGAR|nr:hypothetical protein DFH08DRAFT_816023 [Mycena albidolilacea]
MYASGAYCAYFPDSAYLRDRSREVQTPRGRMARMVSTILALTAQLHPKCYTKPSVEPEFLESHGNYWLKSIVVSFVLRTKELIEMKSRGTCAAAIAGSLGSIIGLTGILLLGLWSRRRRRGVARGSLPDPYIPEQEPALPSETQVGLNLTRKGEKPRVPVAVGRLDSTPAGSETMMPGDEALTVRLWRIEAQLEALVTRVDEGAHQATQDEVVDLFGYFIRYIATESTREA